MKVQLKKNLKYFESDDSTFDLHVGQIIELEEKHIRSYSIKNHLFHGLLEVVEGELLFKYKAGIIYVAPNTLWCKEYDEYFTKDLEIDTITFIDEDWVPKDIHAKLNSFGVNETPIKVKELIVEKSIVKEELKEEIKIEKLIVEKPIVKKEIFLKTDLIDKIKSQQIEILVNFGLSNSEIKKLSNETLRVNKILELQK